MRNAAILFLFLFSAFQTHAQFELKGSVRDAQGNPIPGAAIQVFDTYQGAISDARGEFRIPRLTQPLVSLEVRSLGYQPAKYQLDLRLVSDFKIVLSARTYVSDEVVVQATRAGEQSGLAHTTLTQEDIRKQNFGQDMPMLLNQQPGVVVNSDAGNGIGYTGIRVRGSDPTRINVTVNGIPMNDPESHGLFWVNMPDFASSVQSVQLQRGAGTSTNGAGAFGATLNMQTNAFRGEPYAAYTASAGSFNTLRHTLETGTGLLGQFTFDVRLSKMQSDGFIERAASDLKSFYLSGAWYGKKTTLRTNIFSGREKTYQAWYGVPQDSMSTRPTYNPAGLYYAADGSEQFYDNETDNYQQDHYQFFINHEPNKKWLLHAALHYTYGRGYYEQYKQEDKLEDYSLQPLTFGAIPGPDSSLIPSDTIFTTDLIRQRWLDNHFYGTVFSATWQARSNLKCIIGGGWNIYDGHHFGEVIWAKYALDLPQGYRYYNNTSRKADGNVYLKLQWEIHKNLQGFIDVQQRQVNYRFLGFNDALEPVDQQVSLSFFNPKAGISWNPNSNHRIFASWSVAHREPVRDDYTQSSISSRPKPEKMNDFELGYRYQANRWKWGLTLYHMQYRDALILTGQINDVGAYNRVNIPESFRQGAEIEFAWQIQSKLELQGNVALSRNMLPSFTEYVTDWDTGTQYAKQFSNTPIAFSPAVVSGATISWQALPFLRIDWIHKYVGKQYLDNTGSQNRMLEAFYITDLRLATQWKLSSSRSLELSAQLSNLGNTLYAPNGYTYSGVIAGQRYDYNFLYPQARRNAMVMLRMQF